MKAFCQQFTEQNLQGVMTRAVRHATEAAKIGAHEMVIRQINKSRDQEEHYHALIGDIAKQYQHCGRKWDSESMKRLLVDAFKHDTKDDPDYTQLWAQMGTLELAPAIGRDGFIALGTQTRRFPKKLACAFITWLYAFGAEQNVMWSDPRWQSQFPDERAAA